MGTLKKIVLGHIEREDEPPTREERNAEWICYQVNVKDLGTNTTYIFPVGHPIGLNKEPRMFKCESKKDSLVNLTRQLKNVNSNFIITSFFYLILI